MKLDLLVQTVAFVALFYSATYALTPATTKVAVVGAGSAGLSAAGVLIQAGFTPSNIYLLEAKPWPGGRMHSMLVNDPTGNWNFSWGSTWIHQIGRTSGDGLTSSEFVGCDNSRKGIPHPLPAGQYCQPIEALCRKHSIPFVTQSRRNIYWDFDGTYLGVDPNATEVNGELIAPGLTRDFGDETNRSELNGFLVFQQPSINAKDSSVTFGLNTDQGMVYEQIGTCQAAWGSTKWRYRQFDQQNYLDNEFGIAPSVMSWRNYNWDDWYSATDGIPVGSYAPIIDVLVGRLAGVNIIYNADVTAMKTSSPASVTYSVSGGSPQTVNVDYIISTVPITSAQKGLITYTPALTSAYLTSANLIVMGNLEKVLLIFDNAFWRQGSRAVPMDVGWGNFISNDVGEYVNINFVDLWNGKNALLFWSASNWSRIDVTRTDSVVQTRLVQIINLIWPGATFNILNMYRSNWTYDAQTWGSYTYWGVDWSRANDPTNLLTNQGRLYFAGEHTRTDFIQTVHGGVFSGVDAANTVCKAVGGCSAFVRHPDMIYP